MRKTKIIGYFIKIIPRTCIYRDNLEEEKNTCKWIIDNVKRHVNDCEDASLEINEEDICSFCGNDWTEDNDEYNGGCCLEDQKSRPDAYRPS